MPLAVTSGYQAVHDQLNRTPAYIVTFTRAAVSYATHRTASVSKAYMQLPKGVAAQIVPEKGQSSVSSITFVLTDFNGEITSLIGLGLGGDMVALKAGFVGLPEVDFATVFTGIVDNFKLTPDLAGYEITAHSPDILANRQVFEVATTVLDGAIDDVVVEIPVVYAQFFLAAGYALIDGEIVQYASKTDGALSGVTRGVLGTTAAAHASTATVQELIRLGPAHPFDIRLSVLQNTDKTGLSIDPALIDLVNAAAVKADIDASNPNPGEPYLMEFRITARENAKQFLENEIHAPTATYPITTAGGLMSMRQFRQPSAAGTEVLDHDSILGGGGNPLAMAWDGNLSSVINDVTYLYDYDVVSDEFQNSVPLSSAASIAQYGKRAIVIAARGIRSELPGSDSMVALRAAAILNRYKDAAPLVTATTILQKGLVEPGDIVRVTSALIPNRFTLARGVTNSLMEAIQRANNYSVGTASFTLLWTGFGLASVYAGELAIDWSTASHEEREQYAFYADAGGLNGGMSPGQRYAF